MVATAIDASTSIITKDGSMYFLLNLFITHLQFKAQIYD